MEDISLIVAGAFHYRYYVETLNAMGRLARIHYSHRWNTLRSLPSVRRCNLLLKEYLMYAHIKLFGRASAFQWMFIYSAIWEFSCWLTFKPARVNVVLLQGNSLTAIKRAKRAGGIVVGEAVNIHPTDLKAMLEEDALATGIPVSQSIPNLRNRLVEAELIDYLIAPSQSVARSFIARGFDERRVRVIPYGVERFHLGKNAVAAPPVRNRVLVLGQIAPRKAQWHLLQALSRHAEPQEFEVQLVGTTDPTYLAALRSIGVAFEHLSHVPHESVGQLIAGSSVLCLNSIEDGFGMVVTEALACNVPVAVSKYAGAAELVQQIGGGLVHDPYDYPDVVATIRRCLRGEYPSRTAEPPTWESYAARLVDCIDLILQERACKL